MVAVSRVGRWLVVGAVLLGVAGAVATEMLEGSTRPGPPLVWESVTTPAPCDPSALPGTDGRPADFAAEAEPGSGSESDPCVAD
ncbi:hypothetical protein GCM10010497_06770 [Streptomyces cinereoruber]|uniref:Uncharacterized protein n=1 Tax=Streptomyces cinereoruber TaxID=67260 RepID=A0AAV4KEP3_9ACTN|nr:MULTISPECIES: hypothetical protein [Streptomyces]AVH95881.1 hypothetical protein C5L38_13010 [Streptomyces sp. WAC00288]KYG54544.1 hypothetical protein AWI43_08825 [Streptomyces sp. WAC04657]MBB4157136.1 hypothetical protein [Streptomyces cinereoruber]MBY8815047.1 hypothetical protein [Streptomyces cinereoruber]NIH59766.1 hypothetical protein [Streptomyces cinereoruber]